MVRDRQRCKRLAWDQAGILVTRGKGRVVLKKRIKIIF
jgi:hypothetical protein